jgi:hypothetical protein
MIGRALMMVNFKFLSQGFNSPVNKMCALITHKDIWELLEKGQTQGSMLQQRTKKTLSTTPFDNTCEENEVSLEVEAGVVAGLKCMQP